MKKKGVKELPMSLKFLTVILLIISGVMFIYFGYVITNSLLSTSIGVGSDFTGLDLMGAIVGIVSSILIFIGAIFVFKLKRYTILLIVTGSIGFIIKNILSIINEVVDLKSLSNATQTNITLVSILIGVYTLIIVFWIAVLILFSKKSIHDLLN